MKLVKTKTENRNSSQKKLFRLRLTLVWKYNYALYEMFCLNCSNRTPKNKRIFCVNIPYYHAYYVYVTDKFVYKHISNVLLLPSIVHEVMRTKVNNRKTTKHR